MMITAKLTHPALHSYYLVANCLTCTNFTQYRNMYLQKSNFDGDSNSTYPSCCED